jgi:ribosomal protein S18 acetylase RimI-like enzyme
VTIEMRTPLAAELGQAGQVLGQWQHEGAALQLHPGDLGWFWRFGAPATAAAVRVWHRGETIVAVGLLDEPTVLRLAIAPEAVQDEDLARTLATDLGDPARGVLSEQAGCVEAPAGSLLRDMLTEHGWRVDQPWTPLRCELTQPVPDPGVRLEVISPARAHVRVAVQRAAFERSSFTDDRWRAMAAGPLYDTARCLVAYDTRDNAVAAVTVWSAGNGKPGLIEPLGVHRDHRGHGFGTAITLAGAAALRRMGSSSAVVCTPSANQGGVATYLAAGFQRQPDVSDLRRRE